MSKNVYYTKFLQMPSVVSNTEENIGTERWERSGKMIAQLSEEASHDKNSSIEVSKRKLCNNINKLFPIKVLFITSLKTR